jgi:hypothetical protein
VGTMLASSGFPGFETIAATFSFADGAFAMSMMKFELYRNQRKRFDARTEN